MKKRKMWNIIGYVGMEEIFNERIPAHCITDKKMEDVLRQLVCRHLTANEIIWANTNNRKGCYGTNSLLEVTYSKGTMICGTNPYYTSRIIEEES